MSNNKLSAFKSLLLKMKTDKENVLTQALGLSALSYFNSAFIKTIAEKENWKYNILEDQGMLCLIVEYDNKIFIAFRGTMPSKLSNWKKILNIIPKRFNSTLWAHGGFVLVQRQYKNFIQSYIDSLDNTKEIIFTGHSLGAAIASLYNIDYVNDSKCLCFASPNILFNSKFNSPSSSSFRIKMDFVTKIPLSFPFFKWTIPTRSIRINSYYKGFNPIGYHKLTNYISSMMGQDLTKLSEMI